MPTLNLDTKTEEDEQTALVEFDHEAMMDLWKTFRRENRIYCHDEFLALLRQTFIDDGTLDEIVFCVSCGEPVTIDETGQTSDGPACDPCISDRYSHCESCDEYVTQVHYTLDSEYVCESCEENLNYCEHCDGGYHPDNVEDHYHEETCSYDCESPAMAFSVRNDGDEPLRSDVRARVSLPAGVISEEGLRAISQYLHSVDAFTAAYLCKKIDNAWQTREGNYAKRLSRAIYRQDGSKLSADQLSEIGNIARAHSTAIDFDLEVTRDLNQSAKDFGHGDSCYWTSHYLGRCTIKNNGGYGLRTFSGEESNYSTVTGRAWVMPVMVNTETGTVKPTFNALSPDAFIVLNGYGDLSGYVPARIVAHMAGMTYRKLRNLSFGEMYVNGDNGYLVAPEEIATDFTDARIDVDCDAHSNLWAKENVKTEEGETRYVA